MDKSTKGQYIITQLLGHLQLNAKAFSEQIGLDRPQAIYDIQKGKTRNISHEMADKILAAFPLLSRQWLLTGEGSIIPTAEVVLPQSNHVMMVPVVSQYAQAGYLTGFGDEEYMENLPAYPFVVDHDGKGNYIAFEVKGDSMDDGSAEAYNEGDILLCREIQPHLWANSKLHIMKWDFVVVTTEGVLIKRIIDHNLTQNMIRLHSLNPFYEDQEMPLTEVKKIFNVVLSQRRRKR